MPYLPEETSVQLISSDQLDMATVLRLTSSLNSWLVLASPAWILVFCAIRLDRARKIPRGLIVPEGARVATIIAMGRGTHR